MHVVKNVAIVTLAIVAQIPLTYCAIPIGVVSFASIMEAIVASASFYFLSWEMIRVES